MTDTPLPPGLSNDELDELDQILTDLGQRVEEIPQWEFCDGFLTALVCMRRRVEPAEYLPMLLDDGAVLEVEADAPLPLLPVPLIILMARLLQPKPLSAHLLTRLAQ